MSGNGIAVTDVSVFGSSSAGGGISNSGAIAAAGDGILVDVVQISTFLRRHQ